METKYLVCPHCGNRMKDYAVAKALRDSVGAIEKAGNAISPILFRVIGKNTGVPGLSKAFGKFGDKLAKKELLCHTIICDRCHKKFQDR